MTPRRGGGAEEGSLLTVAAPLTCTDLLAMDRVPETLSTGGGTSFCLGSVTVATLRKETEGRNIYSFTEVKGREDALVTAPPALCSVGLLRCWQGGGGAVRWAAG